MAASTPLVRFSLDQQDYALYLSAVERVVPAAEVTSLPKAPEIVLGVLNVGGRIIPVVNIRRRFRLPERELRVQDQLILAHTGKRPVALVVDSVTGIPEVANEQVTAADRILPGLEQVEGVVRLEDGLMLIHDLGKFLSLDEEQELGAALETFGSEK